MIELICKGCKKGFTVDKVQAKHFIHIEPLQSSGMDVPACEECRAILADKIEEVKCEFFK